MSDLSKVKSKIQALLAKANGTDNEHEAEAFMGKAMELMAQYQLEIADLVDADPIINHPGLKGTESGHAWRWKLYRAVAVFYGCETIHWRTRDYMPNGKVGIRYEHRLVGAESAILTVDLMYPWIVSQVRSSAKDIAKLTGMSADGQAKRVAAALITRIWKLINEMKEAAPVTPSQKNALVVKGNVLSRFEELYPDTSKMKSRGGVSDGLSRKAAEGIGLYRQTSGKAQGQLT